MGNKQKLVKRKIENPVTDLVKEESEQPPSSEDELSNTVNEEDDDSSDDEGSSFELFGESEEEEEDEEEEETEEEEAEEEDLEEEEQEEEDIEEEEEEESLSEEEEINEEQPKELSKTSNPNSTDEYADHDTSDEEDIRNTVGNIPMTWYDSYEHLGYDWDGQPIPKPAPIDHVDAFLRRIEQPDFWRTVTDPQTGRPVVLSDADVAAIRRLQTGALPTTDDDAPWIEWFTREVQPEPVRAFPEHKRSFLPSRSDAVRVSKLVHALKMGWIKTRAEAARLRAKRQPQFYMLWAGDDEAEPMRRIHKHLPAPKRSLPGHAESYNPPPEYLFDGGELKEWHRLKNAPQKRKLHFLPQRYDGLRAVPAYPRFIKERFLRCLDLYLCPRGVKMKLDIEPEALVPKLPSPRDLQPFPILLALEYRGHSDMVRSITIDPSGQFLASGSDDGTVKFWEVNTGRCLKTMAIGAAVRAVEWCPNQALALVLVASGNQVLLLNPHLGDFLVCAKTDEVLSTPPQGDCLVNERIKTTVQWVDIEPALHQIGVRLLLRHFKEVTQVTWHGKGDYFASVMPEGLNRSVLISQISRRRSQLPFTKSKGLVQCVLFHPSKPYLFVATQRHVRIYDLVKQNLMKKLMTNSKWISAMAVHPGGDNLLVGTYDRKMLWFDLDLSTKPYQTLRLHGTAVRGVAFHRRYPLFASGSDDKSVVVCHGMVYNDLLKNPLIVPLKRLQDHEGSNDFGIFDVLFHPLQPWVFSAGADGTIKLYSN